MGKLDEKERINPFQFSNDIGYEKKDIPKEVVERYYEPWMVNRIFSLYPDTIFAANELNTSRIDANEKHAQYKYLTHSIKPKKRFAKWVKKTSNDDIAIVATYYNCSQREALEYLALLNLEQVNELQKRISKGGRKGE